MDEIENTPIDIASATQMTAQNLYELLMELAAHIRKLEAENAELRNKVNDR
jgi:hypothetical protein